MIHGWDILLVKEVLTKYNFVSTSIYGRFGKCLQNKHIPKLKVLAISKIKFFEIASITKREAVRGREQRSGRDAPNSQGGTGGIFQGRYRANRGASLG